ncbi:MAG: hypothetical protein R3E32_07585 [Chitinophagales bacterium]
MKKYCILFIILAGYFLIPFNLFGQKDDDRKKNMDEQKLTINNLWEDCKLDDSFVKHISKPPRIIDAPSLYEKTRVKYALISAFYYAHNCDIKNAIYYKEMAECLFNQNLKDYERTNLVNEGYQILLDTFNIGVQEKTGKFEKKCLDAVVDSIEKKYNQYNPCEGNEVEVKVRRENLKITMDISVPIKFKNCNNVKSVFEAKKDKFGLGHLGHTSIYKRIVEYVEDILANHEVDKREVNIEITGHADSTRFDNQPKYPYKDYTIIPKGIKYNFTNKNGKTINDKILQKEISNYIYNNEELSLARAHLAKDILKNMTTNPILLSAFHHNKSDKIGTFRKVEIRIHINNALNKYFENWAQKMESELRNSKKRCKDLFKD